MAAQHAEPSSSVVVPILLGVLVLAFVVSLVREQVLTNKTQRTTIRLRRATDSLSATVTKLHAIDVIACTFIVADAKTRNDQAVNSNKELAAQQRYTRSTRRLLRLFKAPAPNQTPAQKATVKILDGYLASQILLSSVLTEETSKNIVLAQTLAAKANQLAATLPCR